MARNYYQILGLGRDATSDEIKRAFRRVARATHPDSNPGDPAAEARFREAAEAYEILSDPERRRRYDRGDTIDLSDLFSGFGGWDDLLRSVFGDGGLFGSAPSRPSRGRDVLVTVEVDLAEAVLGAEVPVSFNSMVGCDHCSGSGAEPVAGLATCPECGGAGSVRMARRSLFGTMMTVSTCPRCRGEGTVVLQPCSVCEGSGAVPEKTSLTVEVPPGVTDGTRLRLSGRGEAGGRSSTSGDLFVEIRVRSDPRFRRVGDDLVHTLGIGIGEAVLGTRVEVPLIDGGRAELEIPAGTQPGAVLRVGSEGAARLGRRGRGDLLVEVTVRIPTDLEAEEEALLRRWAELRGERIDRPAKQGG